MNDTIIRPPYSCLILAVVAAFPFIFPSWSDGFVLGRRDWIERRGILEFWDTMLNGYAWPVTALVALINPFNLRIQDAPWRSAFAYTLFVAAMATALFVMIPFFDSFVRDRDLFFLNPAPHIQAPNLTFFAFRTLIFSFFPFIITGCALWVRSDWRRAMR